MLPADNSSKRLRLPQHRSHSRSALAAFHYWQFHAQKQSTSVCFPQDLPSMLLQNTLTGA